MTKTRGKSSIVHDVKMCLKEIDMIGLSKREFRSAGIKGIHSKKQKEHTMSACQNFVKWTRSEYGVRKVHELTQEHFKAYMSYLEREGRSIGHRQNVETAIKHLQAGLNARSLRFNKPSVTFVPEKRITPFEGRQSVSNRSYTNVEIKNLLKRVSPATSDAIKLMRGLGLRVREAATIRVEHFKKVEQGWKVHIEKGTGITKGGRFRYLDVPKSFERELERMLYGKSPGEQLIPIKLDTIRQSVSKGLKKAGIVQKGRGCHGFRHAFARERVADMMNDKGLHEKGYAMLQRVLENRTQGKLANYGIFREEDKKLFEQVRQVINVVHGEIGHGNDRWDLAEVYMKE